MKTVQHWTLTRTPWNTRISQETEMNFIEITSFSYSILNYTLLKSYQSYCEFLMTRFFVLNFFCRDASLTCICYNFCLTPSVSERINSQSKILSTKESISRADANLFLLEVLVALNHSPSCLSLFTPPTPKFPNPLPI